MMILVDKKVSPYFSFSLPFSQWNFIYSLFAIIISGTIEGSAENQICGSITTKSGDTILLKENETLSQHEFDKVRIRKLKNAIFSPEEKCIIKVCGFTSYSAQQDGCIGSGSDQMDCHMIKKRVTADGRYNDRFNASSISCGCYKETKHFPQPCETKCNLKKQYVNNAFDFWKEDECAILYQQSDCQDCYFDPIRLGTGEEFSTDNSHHINTVIVRDQCTVKHNVRALKRLCNFKDSSGIVTYASNQDRETRFTTQSAFQVDPEIFSCTCPDSPFTSAPWPVSNVSGTSETPRLASTPILPPDSDYPYGQIALVAVSAGFIVVSSIAIYFLISRRRRNLCGWKKTDLECDVDSNQTYSTNCSESLDFNPILNMNPAFETSPEHFELGTRLGGGNFGDVCKGTVQVAIKTAKKNSNDEVEMLSLKSLLHEIKILSYLGSHENVIRYMGASAKNFENGEIYLFTEYCQNGCLKSYLKNTMEPAIIGRIRNRQLIKMTVSEDGYPLYPQSTPECIAPNIDDLHPLELRQFLQWSEEIANGMQYITSKNVVHIDLAARNVLISHNLTAKIGDFGLSKKIYVQEYVSTKKESFPIMWAAPECLKNCKYSNKSDIWAYGITLWEIFTLGKDPYNKLDSLQEIICAILRGEGLARAEFAPDDVHAKLLECWREKPEDRPSFEDLREYFVLKKNQIELEPQATTSRSGCADSHVQSESEGE